MWHIENLHADNDATFLTSAMRISADAVAFYNPVTQVVEGVTVNALALGNLMCTINSIGPGGRDSTTPYVAGNVVWFYLIYSATLGIETLNSLIGPAQVNSYGTVGPMLPAGFTSYCRCFPLILVGEPTLQPLGPKSGPSNIQVRGNEVQYINRPLILGGSGYPLMPFNLSAWIPPCAQLTIFDVDAEIHSSAGGPVIGGVVLSMTGVPNSNFKNISLYPPNPSSLYVQDTLVRIGLGATGQKFTCTFSSSSGVVDGAVCDIFVNGYTF